MPDGVRRGAWCAAEEADMVELLGPGGVPRPDDGHQRSRWADVPWRTIVATIGIVVATLALVALVSVTLHIVLWVMVSGFFAIVLAPAVARVQRKIGGPRSLATSIVMFSSALLVIGMLTVFAMPVRSQAVNAATDLPGTIDSAVSGNGPVGHALETLHLQSFVRDHQQDIENWANNLSGSSISIARQVISVVVAIVTIFVLTFLFLTQSESMGRTALSAFPARRRPAAKRAAADAAHAVSGYMLGNLLISLIAGLTALVCLVALGVPNPIVLALWVAFADLIPLVGATIGAALAVLAAFLHSPTAGIVSIIFFVVYQQFENSVLQPLVMSRTVKVNPLVVILSVLIGVEVLGVVGAILAIPIVGALQVAARAGRQEYYQDRLRIGEPLNSPPSDTSS
jgi:predicted PurR-regulated permease PerM